MVLGDEEEGIELSEDHDIWVLDDSDDEDNDAKVEV